MFVIHIHLQFYRENCSFKTVETIIGLHCIVRNYNENVMSLYLKRINYKLRIKNSKVYLRRIVHLENTYLDYLLSERSSVEGVVMTDKIIP
jgi:transposase-like protein